MIIATAYSNDYEKMKDNLVASTDLTVIAERIPEEVVQNDKQLIIRANYKPSIVRKAMEKGDDVAWIDSDCLIKDLDNPLGDCDVAVTLRRPIPRDMYHYFSGLLNSGVIFFKNNDNGKRFVDIWEASLEKAISKGDQEALNIATGITDDTKVGDVLETNGIRIKVLSCDEYNFFYFPEENKAKVLHYKGNVRHHYPLEK